MTGTAQWYAILDVHADSALPDHAGRGGLRRLAMQFEPSQARGAGWSGKSWQGLLDVRGARQNAGQFNYSSAKDAVTGMTRTHRQGVGTLRGHRNYVAFGYIQTRLTQADGRGGGPAPSRRRRQVKAEWRARESRP